LADWETYNEDGFLTRSTATIKNGESVSNAIRIKYAKYVGLLTPSAWTAADIAFQVSHDGSTFVDLYDDSGSRVTVTAAASRAIALDLAALSLSMWDFVKLESVSTSDSDTAVNQGAERTITVVSKG
jgi:hypothetical protein